MSQIKQNLDIINKKILDAENHAGRPQGSVKLMAVSKFHPIEDVIQSLESGQTLFGENRVQEAYSKFKPVFEQYSQTELHMIGQLQTNKVKHAVEIASCIESVDRIELLQEIEKQCRAHHLSDEPCFSQSRAAQPDCQDRGKDAWF